MFPKFPFPKCFPLKCGIRDTVGEIWRAEAKQQLQCFLHAQTAEQVTRTVVAHTHHLLLGLGQQAGMQLLCFPLDSSLASSLAFRMETMRTDRGSALSSWVLAGFCSPLF